MELKKGKCRAPMDLLKTCRPPVDWHCFGIGIFKFEIGLSHSLSSFQFGKTSFSQCQTHLERPQNLPSTR